jgi:CRP/FNR family nitrogen fixation transcriptional regulator
MSLAHPATTARLNDAAVGINDIIDRLGVRMVFAKGEEIFGQDEDADLVYSIAKGAVRTTRFLRDGRRQIGDFYYAGDLVGLETGDTHKFCAEALSDCIIHVVKRSALQNPDAADVNMAVWNATRLELERTQDHLLVLGRKSAREKVASFLLDAAQRQDREGKALLHMGRQDIADYLGLTIETVSRMVTQLQADQVITFTNSREFCVRRLDALEGMAQ